MCTWGSFCSTAVAVQSCVSDTVVFQPPAADIRQTATVPSVRASCTVGTVTHKLLLGVRGQILWLCMSCTRNFAGKQCVTFLLLAPRGMLNCPSSNWFGVLRFWGFWGFGGSFSLSSQPHLSPSSEDVISIHSSQLVQSVALKPLRCWNNIYRRSASHANNNIW